MLILKNQKLIRKNQKIDFQESSTLSGCRGFSFQQGLHVLSKPTSYSNSTIYFYHILVVYQPIATMHSPDVSNGSDDKKEEQPPSMPEQEIPDVLSNGTRDKKEAADPFPATEDSHSVRASEELEEPRPASEELEEPRPAEAVSSNNTRKDLMRRTFNLLAFGTVFDTPETSIPTMNRVSKKQSTRRNIDNIIHVLRHWDTGDNEYQTKVLFRQKNKNGYTWAKKFSMKKRSIQGEESYILQMNTGRGGREVIAVEDMFDAIYDAHGHVSHKKVAPTFNQLKKTYYSITEDLVKIYINSVCTICGMTRKKKRSVKGAATPIISSQYRARIQADLVDYRYDPRVDHNNVTLKWLLVVKDHFTKFSWIRTLRSKEAKLVAAEITRLFCEIGWPLIFHHDNGSEFIAKVVRDILEGEPLVCTVTGQPRKPTDQGSVERLNQEVKKVMDHEIMMAKERGVEDPSWVDLIPQTTVTMNNTVSYGNNQLTPYQHVYGMDYDCPIITMPLGDMAKLKTVADLAAYAQNYDGVTDFLKEQGYDVEKMLFAKKDGVGMPDELMLERHVSVGECVSKENLVGEGKGDLDEIKGELHEGDDFSKIVESKVESNTNFTVSKTRTLRRAVDALQLRPQMVQLEGETEQFKFVLADLSCDHCKNVGTNLLHLSIGENAYYTFCESSSERWWEISVLLLFGVCQFHQVHRNDMIFLDCTTPNVKSNPLPLTLPSAVESVVSVVLKDSHYAVLEFVLDKKKVNVYDGLKVPVRKWAKHIDYILKQIGGRRNEWKEMQVHKFHGRPIFQPDGHNCGPVACMVMWGLFNPGSTTFTEAWKSSNMVSTFRRAVVKEMKGCLKEFEDMFVVRSRSDLITFDNDETEGTGEAGIPDCSICLSSANTSFNNVTSLPQCSHIFHDLCIIEWQKQSLSCPLCKKVPVDVDADNAPLCQFLNTVEKRQVSDKKRKVTQTKQAEKMKRLRGECVTVDVGDTVRVRVPKVDKAPCKSMDLLGVVLMVRDKTKSITVATRHGIIGRGSRTNRSPLFLTPDRYEVIGKLQSLHKDLASIQDQVKGKANFNSRDLGYISMAAAHKKEYAPKTVTNSQSKLKWGSRKCKCKARCNPKKCGCLREGFLCGSGCGCGGTCEDAAN